MSLRSTLDRRIESIIRSIGDERLNGTRRVAFNPVKYYQALYRNSPWVAISIAFHAVLGAILSFMAFSKTTAVEEKPVAIGVSAQRSHLEEATPEPIDTIDRKLVPANKEGFVADSKDDGIDTFTDAPPTTEDERVSKGDPFALTELPPGAAGGTSIGVGNVGHYSVGVSPWASQRVGGGVGGKYGGRFFGNGRGGGTVVEQATTQGLEWLKWHQSPDGRWDCAHFMDNCGHLGPTKCDGAGESTHNVGMTGLALLAFLGCGNTTREGPYREVVSRGVHWLKDQQDAESGLLGEKSGHSFLYDHAIGTLALCEAYYFARTPVLKKLVQPAVNLITRARNPYKAWRYDLPPSGKNDTSVTGWMVFALTSAEEAKLDVDKECFAGALAWIDEVTDQTTGRVGYDAVGTASSRVTKLNEDFPTDKGEAMTAVGLLCRIFLGQTPDKNPMLYKHADLLLTKLPIWDPKGKTSDFYYWYYGTYAMYQIGGKYWEPWKKAMEAAVVKTQRTDDDAKGSWDPIDPWGWSGGRVYSTALLTLCLEVYFRYGKVLGARAELGKDDPKK